MDKNIAISVQNVSKTFKIPHEKITSLRGAAVSVFKKGNYEEFKALDNVSFDVHKGEFLGVIGRNGSGKSTLLKILAGIYKPDKGKIKISGRISPFLELGIGFNPELSGRDNIYLNATVLGLTKKEIDEKFDSIVKFSELERFIDQKLKNYSSGMEVRLAFSVSIHANRDILLMDEVLAVGDSNFQNKCLAEFNNYKKLGKTVILVSHDIATVQRYCDRIMLLRNGKIEAIGNADTVAEKYIFQNLTDEKDRASLQNGKGDIYENVDSNKKVVIEKVEFLNAEKKDVHILEYDQEVTLRMHLNAADNVKGLTFGYHIRDLNGNVIVYTDSLIENIELGDIRMGRKLVIDCKFKAALIHGNYKIACSLSVPINLKKSIVEFCDYIGSAVSFTVKPRQDSLLYGSVHWKNSITVEEIS